MKNVVCLTLKNIFGKIYFVYSNLFSPNLLFNYVLFGINVLVEDFPPIVLLFLLRSYISRLRIMLSVTTTRKYRILKNVSLNFSHKNSDIFLDSSLRFCQRSVLLFLYVQRILTFFF